MRFCWRRGLSAAVRVLCMAFVRTLPAWQPHALRPFPYGFQPAAMGMSAPSRRRRGATALGIYTAAQMPAGTILANAIAVPALGAGSLRAVFLLFSPWPPRACALLFCFSVQGPYAAAAQKEAV